MKDVDKTEYYCLLPLGILVIILGAQPGLLFDMTANSVTEILRITGR